MLTSSLLLCVIGGCNCNRFNYQDFVGVCRSVFNQCKADVAGAAPVATVDFLRRLETSRAEIEQKELFPDLAIVQSTLSKETIESADAFLFQLSKTQSLMVV
jgi:hypothetical protein